MRNTDPYAEAYERGWKWGRTGKDGYGWCHYDSYLEPELVTEWWAGFEAGQLEYLLAGGRRVRDL